MADNSDAQWNKLKDQIVNTTKTTWDGASTFVKGMGQSFGYVTPDYRYSFKVWNDSPAPIFVAVQKITPVLGADFAGTLGANSVVNPNDTSGENFYSQQLYISIWLCADANSEAIKAYASSISKAPAGDISGVLVNKLFGSIITTEKLKQYSFLRRDIYPWAPHDANIYYYRAYTDNSVVKGEYLGIKETTTEFLGTFYNNTDSNDVKLTFLKDNETYTVSLEPRSFNFLQSTPDKSFSIRPSPTEQRGFSFTQSNANIGYFPLAVSGIANVVYNEKTKKYDSSGPMSYTYEIYEQKGVLSVSMQGLSIGNFTQPLSGRLRDINPVNCHVWYQSSLQESEFNKKNAQASIKDASRPIFYDAPEVLWLTYHTNDFTLYKNLKPGSYLDFTLLRPKISEKEAVLYGVLLPTDDEKKAKVFLDRLNAGNITLQSIYSTGDDNSIERGINSGLKNGSIVDKQGQDSSGLTGYVVFTDIFTHYGITGDSYYYYLEPSILKVEQLINAFYFQDKYYVKDVDGAIVLSEDFSKEFKDKILNWIRLYQSDKAAVRKDVIDFVMQAGNPRLFNDTQQGGQKTLSDQAKHMIEMFITGPISIENYPLMRKAGTNYYVYGLGSKPSGWPV